MAFKDIVGHERVKKNLTSIIENNRITTGYIFHGINGVGTTLMAKTFAKALNCKENNTRKHVPTGQAGTIDSCDKCQSCKSIDNLSNLDFSIIEPMEDEKGKKKKNISIAQIREIKIKYASCSALLKYRVTIIEKADELSDEAANAFLKILEEPPANSIFILTTSKIHSIIPTICSRCQKVRFGKLTTEEMKDFLVLTGFPTRTSKEKHELPLQLANGSIKKLLKIMEPDFKKLRHNGLKFIKLLPVERLKMIENIEKMDLKEFIMSIQELYRDLLVKTLEIPELIRNKDLEAEMENDMKMEKELNAINICEQSYHAIEKNVNKNFILYRLAKDLPHLEKNNI